MAPLAIAPYYACLSSALTHLTALRQIALGKIALVKVPLVKVPLGH